MRRSYWEVGVRGRASDGRTTTGGEEREVIGDGGGGTWLREHGRTLPAAVESEVGVGAEAADGRSLLQAGGGRDSGARGK